MQRCQTCHYPSPAPVCSVCSSGVPVRVCTVQATLDAVLPTLVGQEKPILRGRAATQARHAVAPPRWTPESIHAQVQAWYAGHGRAPTMADLKVDPALPQAYNLTKYGLTLRGILAALGIALQRRPGGAVAALVQEEHNHGS